MEGIFKFLSIPIGWLMRAMYSVIPSYIVVILLFALLIKVLLFPLGIKQQKNMVKQASLRPKEAAIRKKYAGRTDKVTQQKMQNEIMELYKSENFNPMGGCLPMFLQLPILYGFYFVIRSPLTYICGLDAGKVETLKNVLMENGMKIEPNTTEIGMISMIRENSLFDKLGEVFTGTSYTSVDMLPSFKVGPIDLSATPGFHEPWYLLAIPVLTFVIMFLTMRLSRKLTYQPPEQQNTQSGCAMKGMDYVFPLMSVWITFITPAIIGVYWIFQNILGTVQQLILKKMLPYPTFTDEELKAAEKEILGTNRKNKKQDGTEGTEKPRVRSLHHIDDDEYNAALEAAEKTGRENTAKEDEGGNELIGKARLKEDDRREEK